MSYVLGADLSTRAVHLAAVPLHEPALLGRSIHLTHADIEQPKRDEKVDPAERAIRAHQAARTCLHVMHARGLELHSACVEYPAGRVVAAVTQHAFAAVCCALDELPVASMKPAEWRRAIGCVGRGINDKDAGHVSVVGHITGNAPTARLIASVYGKYNVLSDDLPLSGDELDSLGVALAHRACLLKQEAAA